MLPSVPFVDDEVTSQQVLVLEVLYERALHRECRFRRPRSTWDRSTFAKDCVWKRARGGEEPGDDEESKGGAMIIKWNDAYPIESFRLKNMAIHSVQLPPPTSATSVDASFGKWNNINVINDGKHQLIDQFAAINFRDPPMLNDDEISL